ncbi:hypothetical protein AgCh_018824 [Apium graveolens]
MPQSPCHFAPIEVPVTIRFRVLYEWVGGIVRLLLEGNKMIDLTIIQGLSRLAALSSQPLRLTSHVVYEHDVDWTSYKSLHKDPARYKEQQLVATYVGAIICNNYVAYHKPHLAAEQFPVLEDFDLQNLCWQLKQNKGDSEQHLLTYYKDHIKEWNERLLLKDHLQKNHSSPSTVHMQRNHPTLSHILSPTLKSTPILTPTLKPNPTHPKI